MPDLTFPLSESHPTLCNDATWVISRFYLRRIASFRHLDIPEISSKWLSCQKILMPIKISCSILLLLRLFIVIFKVNYQLFLPSLNLLGHNMLSRNLQIKEIVCQRSVDLYLFS